MRKGVFIFGLVLFLCLSLVSAFSFGDLWGKITGEVVDNGWTCVDSDGGKLYNIKGTTTGCLADGACGDFEDICIGTPYDPTKSYELTEYFCKDNKITSSTHYCNCVEGACYIVDDEEINVVVKEGWNLLYWFLHPEEQIIEGGDIQSENIISIYQSLPVSKTYVNLWKEGSFIDENNLDESDSGIVKIRFLEHEINVKGYDDEEILNRFAVWVYSDKDGILKYVDPRWNDAQSGLENTQLIRGWNFIGISQDMFGDEDIFTINNIKGNCDVLQAYFSGIGGEKGEWIPIGLDENIDISYKGKGFIAEVLEDCLLGKTVEGITCIDTDKGNNRVIKGTVTLTNSEGTFTETDSCEEDILNPDYDLLIEKMCGFRDGDIVEIATVSRPCFNCENGGCILNLENIPLSDGCLDLDYPAGYASDNPQYSASGVGLKSDWSLKIDKCYSNGAEVESCVGEGCSVKEYFCEGDLRKSEIIGCGEKGSCEAGRCFDGIFCRLENINEKICTYDGVDYLIKNLGGCGTNPTIISVAYESNTEELSVDQTGKISNFDTLSNGVKIANKGAPCSVNILNLEIYE